MFQGICKTKLAPLVYEGKKIKIHSWEIYWRKLRHVYSKILLQFLVCLGLIHIVPFPQLEDTPVH